MQWRAVLSGLFSLSVVRTFRAKGLTYPTLLVAIFVLYPGADRTDAQTMPSTDTLPTTVPAVARQDIGGAFWRIDGNFDSVLRLKNVLETTPLVVTPVLWMADGTEYALAPVTLDKAGVAAIDLNEVLRNAPSTVSSHVSEYGSAGVRYSWGWRDVVIGQVTNTDDVNSLTYTSTMSAMLESNAALNTFKAQQNLLQGMWWRRDAGVEPFLTLANGGMGSISAHVSLSDESNTISRSKDVVLGPRQSQLVRLTDLLGQLPSTSTAGGLSVSYGGKAGTLVVDGGLENFKEGYSAPTTFVSGEAQRMRKMVSASATTFAAIGVEVGKPDPMMAFPEGTFFVPYATIRNLNGSPVHVAVATAYMNPQPATSRLGDLVLEPNETRQVDLAALLKSAGLSGYSGEMNFTFTIAGGGDELLIATGSTSTDGNYVFSVQPMMLVPETGKIFCSWGVSGKTDTMISFWNSGAQAEDAELILFFEGGQYRLPVHLEANASSSVSLGSLIKSARPDADGNVIPSNIIQGSARLTNPHGRRTVMNIHAHASVFNVETATCRWICPDCDNVVYVTEAPTSGAATPGGNLSYTLTATMNTGGTFNATQSASWSSTATNIATVTATGTQAGLTHAVSAGSSSIKASYHDTGVPSWQPGSASCQPTTQCPVFLGNPTEPITVQVPTSTRIISSNPNAANSCPSGQAGWNRYTTRAVTDQSGVDIKQDGQQLAESLTMNNNGLALTITLSPASTDFSGQFRDHFAFCSGVCTTNPSATTSFTQHIVDTFNGTYPLQDTAFVYACGYITVNGSKLP